MKLPVKRGWTRYTSGHDRYELALWTQPWHLWLWAKIYHWYDMRIYRVPGVKALTRWQVRHHKHPPDIDIEEMCDRCTPLTNRQDLKCHDFMHRKRTQLVQVEVSEETYRALKGHDE